MIEETFATEV